MGGLEGEVNPWILLKRGDFRERVDVDGTVIGDVTDEVTQRYQLEHWKKVMMQP